MRELMAASVQLKPVRRIKFDLWLFEVGLDNVGAGRLLDAHPLTVGRWRKQFDDDRRRVPPADKVRDIFRLSEGVVGLEDWHRPCGISYVPIDAEAGEGVR